MAYLVVNGTQILSTNSNISNRFIMQKSASNEALFLLVIQNLKYECYAEADESRITSSGSIMIVRFFNPRLSIWSNSNFTAESTVVSIA
jgi:hypothetical protein